MRDYTHYASKLTGRCAKSRVLTNNTKLIRIDETTIAVELHSTNVVTYHADGRIVFNSGGYRTMMTKARMGEFSPARVDQRQGNWTITIAGVSAPFADGITWTGSGWTGAGEDPAANIKLVKRIKAFSSAYMERFAAGDVPKPDSGDCWGCLMRGSNGESFLGSEHIIQHLDEGYYVPSLLARAIERYPVSRVAMAYVSDKWAGTNNGEFAARIGREQLGKSLYRYLKNQLGIAA